MELKWNTDLPAKYWIAAAELFVSDAPVFWSNNPELSPCILLNDTFVPAADAHEIKPQEIFEVLEIARSTYDYKEQHRLLAKWSVRGTELEDETKWWCNRKRL